MSQIKRVLMISYFFPPSPAVGALRAGKFYQYLPDYGWEPHVLTVYPMAPDRDPDMPRVIRTAYASPWKWIERRRAGRSDKTAPAPSLKQSAMQSAGRQRAYFLLRHVLPMSSVRMPDATLGWYPFAIEAGRAMLRANSFDALWSSHGPPTSHLIAARLHHVSGIPWVADYRDLWSQYYAEARLPFFSQLEARLERGLLATATYITTASEGLALLLANLHDRQIETIYNGYDDECMSPSVPDQQFTMLYTGALYPGKQDIRPFLVALAQACRLAPDFRPRLRFVGPDLSWLIALADEYGLSQIVECLERLPREQVLLLQQSATLLLLFGWADFAQQPGVLPVKMFEYMRTGRPILEVGPQKNESAAIIARCRAGLTLESPEEIQHVLLSWWAEFQRTGVLSWASDMSQVAEYSRRAQARKLAELLDRVRSPFGGDRVNKIVE